MARLPVPLGLAGLGQATVLHTDTGPRAASHLRHEHSGGPLQRAVPALQGGLAVVGVHGGSGLTCGVESGLITNYF